MLASHAVQRSTETITLVQNANINNSDNAAAVARRVQSSVVTNDGYDVEAIFIGSVIGGAVGLVAGGGIGSAIGGPPGLAIGAPIGLVVGAIGGGVTAYYITKPRHIRYDAWSRGIENQYRQAGRHVDSVSSHSGIGSSHSNHAAEIRKQLLTIFE